MDFLQLKHYIFMETLMRRRKKRNYFKWVQELKQIAHEEHGIPLDTNWAPFAFKEYFEDGYAPEDALKEDMSYA